MDYKTDDLRIKEIDELVAPVDLLREFAMTRRAAATVWQTRLEVHKILHGADDRLLVIMGPCSIHDVKAAKDFVQRLHEAKSRLAADLLVVMGVDF
jgi:3-deoxy-7-phosphoheptulonate synthase